MNLQFRDLAEPGSSLSEVMVSLSRALVEDIEKLPDNSVVRIHDIRVGTKKIQGLLRLSGRFIKAADQTALRALTRSVRGAFAGERDEEVLQIRLKEILGEEAAGVKLTPAPVVEVASPAEALEQAKELVHLLGNFDLAPLHARELIDTTTSSYRKARKLMRSCRKKPDDEEMHTWRKRVKDVSYQSLALGALPLMADRAEPLDRLADTLGEYHDLAVLHSRLGPDSPHASLVGRRQKALGKTAQKMARALFSRRPSRFAKKLGRSLRKHSPKA